ncbi:hypothetical protein [Actinophytocola xinjiangensis]|uniref:hypothetical protein n=1 Tax=Actinophytocola xinjiangensis TaxID=485602 RepID=UPI000A071F54|nr:hypothetical protein [Actinophytocola xinjiangensis]
MTATGRARSCAVASADRPSDSAATVAASAGSSPATSRTPSLLPEATTSISPPHTAAYSRAMLVMVGANAVEPTIRRSPSTQSTAGPAVAAPGRRTSAAIHNPVSSTPNVAVTHGQVTRRSSRSSRTRRCPVGPETSLVSGPCRRSAGSLSTTISLNRSRAVNASDGLSRTPCHTGGDCSTTRSGSTGTVPAVPRRNARTSRCGKVSRISRNVVGGGEAGSVEKNRSPSTSLCRSSSVVRSVGSEIRAFQMTRPPNVNSTGSPRSPTETFPPVLRIRMTTKLRRRNNSDIAISSGTACPVPPAWSTLSPTRCSSVSSPTLESLCTRYNTRLRREKYHCATGLAMAPPATTAVNTTTNGFSPDRTSNNPRNTSPTKPTPPPSYLPETRV